MTTNKQTIYFYDTSALLSGAYKDMEYGHSYVSSIVLDELEHIKTSAAKDNDVKYKARKLVRFLMDNDGEWEHEIFPQRAIDKVMKKHSFLVNKNDSYLIAEALLLTKKYRVVFITQDACQYLIIKDKFPQIKPEYYISQENTDELFTGWRHYELNDAILTSVYNNQNGNILGAKENQYCVLKQNNEIIDVVVWRNGKYEALHDRELKNAYIGEKIKARNIEQRMAIDLLLNQDIKVKLLVGGWGSGKTLLALTYAFEQIGRGKYDKLVFVRNNIITANTKDVGYLPGDLRDKTKIWAMCLADHIGGEMMLDQMLDEGVVEVFPISHIRGRSINRSIVLCDEGENLTKEHVQLLLSRIENGSEIIFCGDIKQVDAKIFEANNGINCTINVLQDESLFGMVKLIKSERGEVPKLADKFD